MDAVQAARSDAAAHSAAWGSFYCVATHRWGYACCLLCEKDAECGKVPALEAASGESGLPGEGLVGSVAAAGGAAAAVAQEAAEAASAPTPARGTAEVVRILGSDKTKPFQVLGLPTVGATSYAVRTAFRRLALLVHPDKNPGEEERCHQALLRAQQAREAALALLASPPKAAEGAGVQAPKGPTRGPAPRPRDDAASAAREPQHRKEFASAEAYVSYALQYVFDEWQRFVDLALGGPNDEKRKKATEKRAVAAAASGGAEGVLRSQVAMQQTSKSVKALQKLLKNQALGNDVLAKVERVCRGMLCKEYVEANQAGAGAVLCRPKTHRTLEFMDQKAILFDEADESTHEQMQCHQEFQGLVTQLFLSHLAEVSISEERVEAFLQEGLRKGALHRALAEQLLAAEDFLSFKAMMCKHNADLCREVMTVDDSDPKSPGVQLSGLVSDVVPLDGDGRNSLESGLDEWQIYDAPQWDAGAESDEARRKREEAELQQAIALSLSIEEEKLRQLAQEHLHVEPPPPPLAAGFVSAPLCHLPPKPFLEASCSPPAEATDAEPFSPRLVPVAPMVARKPWGFTSAPLMARPRPPPSPPPSPAEPECAESPAPPAVPRLPGKAGFISAPLCMVPPKPRALAVPTAAEENAEAEEVPAPPTPEEEEEASLAAVEKYRSNLRLWKSRASLAVEPLPEVFKEARRLRLLSDESHVEPSEEERLKRLEHLRRQRDLLIDKRMQERHQQLEDFARQAPDVDGRGLTREDQAAVGRRLVAELSGAPAAAASGAVGPEAAAQMRQALTRQLLQSLASSMQSDAATLEDRLSQLETMRWSAER
ncbi:unnamed protein product [Durusdinium trenchii]|uniref:Cilia- and flagella-associated protein 36 n=1 Tax=Durusdinium trenchii TaxID=1381693 RepID=A0ABP0MQG2_9DINO